MTFKEDQFLCEAVFLEYQKRIESHFKATDFRIESNEKLRLRENELLERALNLEKDNNAEKLKVQAVEYERRLTSLNHAHDAAITAQAMTVPREMFNSFLKDLENWRSEFSKWRDSVNLDSVKLTSSVERLSALEKNHAAFLKDYDIFKAMIMTAQAVVTTKILTWGAALGVIVLLLQIALNWYGKR